MVAAGTVSSAQMHAGLSAVGANCPLGLASHAAVISNRSACPERHLSNCAARSLADRKTSVYSSNTEQKRAEGHRRRARKRSAAYEAFESAEIYNRDGWQCGLCHKSVNPRLAFPHHMSASLDHIVPLSQGGAHARANVQCAHWICNSRKTDGAGGQMRLFG